MTIWTAAPPRGISWRKRNTAIPFNIVHGGVYYTLMDQLAGMATAATGRGGGRWMPNISYLKSARAGRLQAGGRPPEEAWPSARQVLR